ncbi:MAG: Flp family type IVb pilin [Polyangiaceae bacterium]|jgi:pilus assembly protein Flp/PilA|nr:Flp family type IVb pilin [Polyangiaceae bacterium]
MKIVTRLQNSALVRDTRGANMVEYIIMVGLVAVVAIAGFTAFGTAANTKIQGQGTSVGAIPQ